MDKQHILREIKQTAAANERASLGPDRFYEATGKEY